MHGRGAGQGRRADAGRLLTAYHQAELELQAGPGWTPYREVLTAGLARAAEREGIALAEGGDEAFVRAWPDMPVFEDAGPALAALRGEGWRLAILTNCDDDLFATTRPRRALHSYFARRERGQQTDQKKYLRPETRADLSPAARFILDVE